MFRSLKKYLAVIVACLVTVSYSVPASALTLYTNAENCLAYIDNTYTTYTPLVRNSAENLIGDNSLSSDEDFSPVQTLPFNLTDGGSGNTNLIVQPNGDIWVGSGDQNNILANGTDIRLFGADLDSTNSGVLIYGECQVDINGARYDAYSVTWFNVPYFNTQDTVTMQALIVKTSVDNYTIIRNYETLAASSLTPFSPALAGPDINSSLMNDSNGTFNTSMSTELLDGASSPLKDNYKGTVQSGRYVTDLAPPTVLNSGCQNTAGQMQSDYTRANASLKNGGFEYRSASEMLWGGTLNGNYRQSRVDQDTNLQWYTTDQQKTIELWTNLPGQYLPDRGANSPSLVPYEGNTLAELNSDSIGVLFQDVATHPGEIFTYTFAHHTRFSSPETMKLSIGPKPSDYTFQTVGSGMNATVLTGLTDQVPARKALRVDSTDISGAGQFSTYQPADTAHPQNLTDSDAAQWGVYQGTYVVPAGQTCTRFAFVSLEPGGNAGNLLDGIQFSRAVDDEYNNAVNTFDLQPLENDDPTAPDGGLHLVSGIVNSLTFSPVSATSGTTYPTEAGGTVEILANSNQRILRYTKPSENFSGPDSFGYTAQSIDGVDYFAVIRINNTVTVSIDMVAPDVILVDPRSSSTPFPQVVLTGSGAASLCMTQVQDPEGTPLPNGVSFNIVQNNESAISPFYNYEIFWLEYGSASEMQTSNQTLTLNSFGGSLFPSSGSLYLKLSVATGDPFWDYTCTGGQSKIIEIRPIEVELSSIFDIPMTVRD